MVTKKHLPRRTFLQGVGATIALPYLDAMTPAFAAAEKPVTRAAFVYTANGIIMNDWTPAETGSNFAFSKTLKPIETFRDQTVVVSGLAHIRNGQSIDQLLAQQIGQTTPLPSLEIGLQDVRMVGGCDSGYSCAYSNTISWSSPTAPLPYETNPRRVFERLFGDGDTTDPEARAIQLRQNRSLLDFVLQDTQRLAPKLGASDRSKLSDYLDSVREVERRIQNVEQREGAELPTLDRPEGIPPSFEDHVKIMSDLIAIAFQADLTRVVTFMYSREGGNRAYPSISVPDAHHGLSHHQNDPVRMARLQQIDQYHVEMFSYLLGKLRDSQDDTGSLLDNSLVLFGSSLSDSNAHLHDNLPTVLVGGGSGKLKGGRHLRVPDGSPMTNMLLSIADGLDVPLEEFGDSTGHLPGLV